MKPIRITVKLVDKNKIFRLKGKYDPETRLIIAKRHALDRLPLKAEADPQHFYFENRKLVCYVDNANRRTIKISNDDPIDIKKATALNYLTEPAFFKSIMEKRKISTSTMLTLLLAGVGIYAILVTILRAAGFNV